MCVHARSTSLCAVDPASLEDVVTEGWVDLATSTQPEDHRWTHIQKNDSIPIEFNQTNVAIETAKGIHHRNEKAIRWERERCGIRNSSLPGVTLDHIKDYLQY